MKSGLHDGDKDGKYNGVAFVEISQIFAMQKAFFLGTDLFDRVYRSAFSLFMSRVQQGR